MVENLIPAILPRDTDLYQVNGEEEDCWYVAVLRKGTSINTAGANEIIRMNHGDYASDFVPVYLETKLPMVSQEKPIYIRTWDLPMRDW